MASEKIIDKTVYGGLFVDKYFIILEGGDDIQLPFEVWDGYKVGDYYVTMEEPK